MESNPVDLVSYTAPGISWTAPEKSRPWLQPPQLTDISRVALYYIATISDEEIMDDMLDSLETSIPLAVIAQAMMMNGVSNGVHTLDAGILVMPVIIEMIESLALSHKMKYVIYPDDYDKQVSVSNRVAKLAVEKAMNKNPMVEEEEEEIPEMEAKPTGLGSRKQKEVM
jgi:hypothetical protein